MDGLARKASVIISILVFILLIAPLDLLADSLIWAPPELGDLIDEGLEQNKEIQDLENQLQAIEHALQNTAQGTYGICENCGQPIDPARLEIMPETTLCIRCKTTVE